MIPERLDAIARGDLSGGSVHPIFIHIAHLLGCVWYREAGGRVSSDMEAHYHRLVLENFTDQDAFGHVESLQACILVGAYFYLKNQFDAAWAYGKRAYDIIVNNNMHITALSTESNRTFPQPNSPYAKYGHLRAIDEADEQRSVVCYALHCDYAAMLMWSTPIVLPQYLDDEFRALTVGEIFSTRRG